MKLSSRVLNENNAVASRP